MLTSPERLLQIGAGNTLATRQALTLDSTVKGIDAALDQARNLLAAAQGGDADGSASQGAPAKAVEFQLRNGTVSVGTALKTNVKDQILSVTHDESTSATSSSLVRPLWARTALVS